MSEACEKKPRTISRPWDWVPPKSAREPRVIRKACLYAKAFWLRWRTGTGAVVTMEVEKGVQVVAVHAGGWRTTVEIVCTGCDRTLMIWLQPWLPHGDQPPFVCGMCGTTLFSTKPVKELPK